MAVRARKPKTDSVLEEGDFQKEKPRFKKVGVIKALAVIYFVLWIVIGIAALGLMYQFSKGKLDNYVIFSKIPAQSQSQASAEAPTETTLPKIGKINIACAESALKPESIQKLIKDYDINVLTAEEKTAFEKCIVEKPQGSPAASPAK